MAHGALGSADNDVVFGHDLDGALVGDVHDPGSHPLAVGEVDEDLIPGRHPGSASSTGPAWAHRRRWSRGHHVPMVWVEAVNRREMRPDAR